MEKKLKFQLFEYHFLNQSINKIVMTEQEINQNTNQTTDCKVLHIICLLIALVICLLVEIICIIIFIITIIIIIVISFTPTISPNEDTWTILIAIAVVSFCGWGNLSTDAFMIIYVIFNSCDENN